MGGRQFTRISNDGLKFSKLDRFLVSGGFRDLWTDLSVVALDRKLLDHCPILLRDKVVDFGPKPFRAFDVWFEDKDAEEVNLFKIREDAGVLESHLYRTSGKAMYIHNGFSKAPGSSTFSLPLYKAYWENHKRQKWCKWIDVCLQTSSISGSTPKMRSRCHESRNNGRNLMWLLKCFEKASGLRINLSKSKLYGVGVYEVEVEEMAHMLKCHPGKLPFMYLGLPIGVYMNKAGSWGIIMEKFKDTLSEWKAKSISFWRGRLVVINTLERVRKKFFWGGGKDTRKMAWIKWDKVLSKFELGGLNVGSLKASNLGLLGKWWWRFREDGEALWVRVIKSLYGESGGLYETCERVRVRILGTWGNIVRVGREIDRTGVVFSFLFGRKLGNGDGIRFWKDKRLLTFKCGRYPRLLMLSWMKMSQLESWMNGKCMGRWVNGVGEGVLRGRSLGELEELSSVLRDLAPVLGYVDSSRWFLASDEVFSVKHIRELIDEKILSAVTYVEETSWCKFVPRKVNVFIWRLKCGRIPVRSILDNIGIDLDSTLCPCCENSVETIDHIMVRCPLVSAVWSKIFLWWGIGCFNGSSLSDILSSHGLVSSKLESVWQAVI
ncbi:putative RNA-directed DNA polymerase [Tanacetum coccineum]